MLPALLAPETREQVVSFLETTFCFRDDAVWDSLEAFLRDPEVGLFKGPYLNLELPFLKATEEETDAIPLTVRPPFRPYRHQAEAWRRLSSRDSAPRHTLVTTGTSSGKTECFLYPILDHVRRVRGTGGIKAIILYPMNALATDQARRLASAIHEDDRLRGAVRAGMYVGGQERHDGRTTMGPEELITCRDAMTDHPPDILLTNYKMLDLLLMRPADRPLWDENGPETLQYLVVDELHTFDGAQGADVGCLIRRLRHRLGTPPGALTCVGTSATIAGSGEDGPQHLATFASRIFGDTITEDAVVGETRLSATEYRTICEEHTHETRLPAPADCESVPAEGYHPYLQRLARAWFGEAAFPEGALDPEALGTLLQGSEFLPLLLRWGLGPVQDLQTVVSHLAGDLRCPKEDASKLLNSFLALLAEAQWRERPEEEPQPLMAKSQVQIWVRELSRLGREVATAPRFRWLQEETRNALRTKALPSWFCRECGESGWLSVAREGDTALEDDPATIYQHYFAKSKHLVYLACPRPRSAQQRLRAVAMPGTRVCPQCLWFGLPKDPASHVCPRCSEPTEPIEVHRAQTRDSGTRDLDVQACPTCEEQGHLAIVGSRSASLASIVLGHLYTHPLNVHPKLLAFTDSVQDASHRAGFFQARTHRMCLRTALARFITARGSVPLENIGEEVLDYWIEHLAAEQSDPAGYVIAHLTPPDLVELPQYGKAMKPRASAEDRRDMLETLSRRIDWEAAVEFGLQSRRGRTLEKAEAAHVRLREDDVQALAQRARREIHAHLGRDLDPARVRTWVEGIVHEARREGAIEHVYMQLFAEKGGGDGYPLSKSSNARYSEEFAPRRGVPRLLTDRPHGKGLLPLGVTGRHRDTTWFIDWCRSTLEEDPTRPKLDEHELHEYGRIFLAEGVDIGVLQAHPATGGTTVYALRPAVLQLCAGGHLMRCGACNAHITVGETGYWAGAPCRARGCSGRMQPVGTGEESRARFYRDRYLHGAVRRIAAHEHTGLLLRDEREQIENSFKGEDEYAGRADNFNLLTCTSTMEMGINIGDLSSTMLCSVPPSTASYLQRIGRAGRGTGSALILNMATSTNHDLHFFAEPQAMMNGEVRMPGVFLEAPEVLRRHFIAFLFDHLVRDGQITRANWPGTMQKAHKTWEEQTGPFRALVAALAEASEAWWGAFAGAFPEANTQSVADRLREHVTRRAVENTFQTVMDRYTTERSRIQGRLRALRSERDALKKVERPDQTTEERLEEVESQIKAQMSRRSYIDRRETWSILVDHGVLPNYAFPETGVTLNAQVLFPKRWNRQMENHEWVRGAGQAIKDLAPHNSFYAHRRRFDIQRVELGPPEDALCTWRFCSQCRHLARHPAETPPGACPECGASDWRDLGRLRNMHQLKVVASTMSHARSLCGDDAEERNQEHYWIEDFFSIDHTAHESAHVIESLPFGVELLGRVTLRQVNMGRSDVHGTTAPIAQKDMPEQGYRICTGCGVVEDPFGPEETRHAPWCKSRKNPGKGEAEPAPWAGAETSPERLPYLYRELDSEALRLLLPPGSLDADEDSASFQAAFGLGLRLYFGGEAGHLLVRPDERPLQQGDGTRNYLLVFDTVPGGTGYLREIARPEVLGEIFQRSLDHIRTCTCLNAPAESGAGEDPVEDQYPGGCYKCLLSYSMSRQREHIRRETAMRLLSQILENWQHLAESPDNSLQAVPETLLAESALERRFYRALQEAITGEPHHGTWKREIIGGKTAFLFTLANRSWRVLPQVTLGPARGVQTPSRADCLIEPVTPRPGTLPIAVYLDGYDPHVFGRDGSSLLGTDIEKRNAVRRSDRFLVWSISWHDLEGASLETAEMGGLWSIQQWDKLRGGWQQAIMPPLPEMFTPGFQQLLAYLRRPNAVDWQRSLARYLAFATILSGVKTTEAEAERCLNGWLVQDHRALPQPGWEQDGAWSYVQFSVSEALTCYLASRYEEVQGDLAAEDPGPLASRQHIVLRLDDRADLRADREAYELIWRRYQALENVLQFLPNCWRATTEHRDPDAAVFLTPPPATGDDSPWEAWRGHVQPEALPLFEACSAAGLPVPVFGYELLNAAEDVIGAAEMGWKQQKVAVLAPADTADRSAFEAAGWTVVVWDQADVTETLAHALGRE